MLKGYIDCIDTKNMLLRYINFELNKKDMGHIAQHLRNCPKCMEEYSKILSRKKMLKQKMKLIEKKLRMELEISSYIDNEINETTKEVIENMIYTNQDYRNELITLKNMLNLIHKAQDDLNKNIQFRNTSKIIAAVRLKNIRKIKIKKAVSRLFQALRRVLLVSQ